MYMRRLRFRNNRRDYLGTGRTSGRRGYNFFRFGFFLLLALHVIGLYATYDYWAFRMLITHHYIFEEDLDTLYNQALGAQNVRGHFRDFDRMMMSVVTERIREINQDWFTYLYSPTERQESLARERADARTIYFEAVTDDVVRLFIPNMTNYTRRFVRDNRSELARYPYLILDLRSNYGGWLAAFHQIADLFVERGDSIGHERTRWRIFSNHIRGRRAPYFDFEHIFILQDHHTASATEGLILALQENLDSVTSIGTQTFGKAVGQVTVPLTGGSAVRASVLLVEGPQGQDIHGVGIAPDIEYDGDGVEYVLRLLEGAGVR